MIHKKHLLQTTALAAFLSGAPFINLYAQTPGDGAPRPPHGPPPSPLFDALDANHDGVISADEINNASTALKGLLKNGATQLTRDDVRPPHPPRERDEENSTRPRPGAESFRPHHPPPVDDRASDDTRPPRSREDAENKDHAFHRPPPRASDDQMPDAQARTHAPIPDATDRPDAERPRPFRDDAAEHPQRHHAPPSPLFDALDTNHDGVISADEITNAAESLKKLDHSGSGQIKRDDLRPAHGPFNNDN